MKKSNAETRRKAKREGAEEFAGKDALAHSFSLRPLR